MRPSLQPKITAEVSAQVVVMPPRKIIIQARTWVRTSPTRVLGIRTEGATRILTRRILRTRKRHSLQSSRPVTLLDEGRYHFFW